MRYLSLFSGMEAAHIAWAPLGWTCAAVAEIDPNACALLRHRLPDVPNLGSVTDITDDAIAALGRIDVVIGGSPCFTAGHLVLARRGLVPIEDVRVGDEVWTHLSRWKPVTATMTRCAPTVMVNGQGHPNMRSTPDHPFFAMESGRSWNGNGYTRTLGEPRWVPASDMTAKRWATPLGIDSGDPVPDALLSESAAYLAGLYVGDGHIGRRPNRKSLSVILSVSDDKRATILPRLREGFGTVSDLPHTQSTWRLQLSRDTIARALLDSFGEHAASKTIPAWVFSAPQFWREAFLEGLIATDGSPIRNGYRVTTVSRALAVGVRLLAADLGFSTSLNFTVRPKTTVIQGRTVSQMDTWTVIFRRGNRASELRSNNHAWGLVRSVKPAGDAEVFDITVADDHSFVCDGLVVHNCQDLSVAGRRAGLAGARSGLFHEQLRIFHAARSLCGARWLVWENVPGAFSSNAGRDFAVVVGELAGCELDVPTDGWGNEGVALGDHGLVEWAVLDSQWFGVAQRRRRVFAVLDTGNWASRSPVLLERDSMRWDSAPRRETGKSVAGTLSARTQGGGGLGTDFECDGGLIPEVCPAITSKWAKGTGGPSGDECQNLIPEVAHTLPVVYPIQNATRGKDQNGLGVGGDVMFTLDQGSQHAIAFDCKASGMAGFGVGDIASTMRSMGHADSHQNGGGHLAVAFAQNQRDEVRQMEVAGALAAEPGAKQQTYLQQGMQVRRLTPRECERLQAAHDDWTLVPNAKGKPMADGPRYRMLGNSFTATVIRWIGRRIEAATAGAEMRKAA